MMRRPILEEQKEGLEAGAGLGWLAAVIGLAVVAVAYWVM